MSDLSIRERFRNALAGWRGDTTYAKDLGTSVSAIPTGVPGAPAVLTAGRDWMNVPFAPGAPLEPWAGELSHSKQTAANEPRTFDYIPSVNVTVAPRIPYGLMPFSKLAYYAENVPEVAMFIRLITDEMKTLKPTIKDSKGDPANIPDLRWMTTYPDQFTAWPVWIGKFLRNTLIYDAAAGFNLRDEDHKIIGLRVIDGSTLMSTIDQRGEQPAPPNPAFTQIIQGTPYKWLTTEELWYRPRFPRTNAPYGTTAVEDGLRAVTYLDNLWTYEGNQYIEGNTPEMVMLAPQDWTPEQVMDFEQSFNSRMAGQSAERRRLRFLPFGFSKIETKQSPWNKEGYEAAFHLVSYMFGFPLSETGKAPGSGLGGKGYQDEGKTQHYRQGIGPLKEYLESPFNDILRINGYEDYTFSLELDTAEIDQEKRSQQVIEDWMQGIALLDEAREARNYNKLPGKAGQVRVVPGGATVVPMEEDIRDVEAQKQEQAVNIAHGKDPAGNEITPQKPPEPAAPPEPDQPQKPQAAVPEQPQPVKKLLDRPEAAADQTGIMVAFYLPSDIADVLTDPAASIWPFEAELVPPSDLHVTLAYLGDLTDPSLSYNQSHLIETVTGFVSGILGPIEGKINGIGRFEAQDGKYPVVANVDVPALPSLRQALVDDLERNAITVKRDHGFTPHVTLGYVPEGEIMPLIADQNQSLPVSFTGLYVAWGGSVIFLPFGADPQTAKLRKDFPAFDLLKHCGVCPDDDAYYMAPISAVTTIPFPYQGANETDIVALSPSGHEPRPALWKPESGEVEDLQNWVGGPMYLREEATYIIDRTLEFYLVPVSYATTLNGEPGSVQHYVRDNQPAQAPVGVFYDPHWVQRAAILDTITGQVDRGTHNWLTHPEDPARPILIDNGLTFPVKADVTLNSAFADAWAGKPIDADLLDSLIYLSGRKTVWQDITDLVGSDAAALALVRLSLLIETGTIPATPPEES